MRRTVHAAARPVARRRAALLSLFGIVVFLTAIGVTSAQTATSASPVLYRLDKGSEYEQGCFGPCACPVLVRTDAKGTIVLTPAGFDGLFTNYKVTEVNWIVSINGSDTLVSGSGTYKVGGDFALQQELSLDLKVGDNPTQHFDSGLVGPSVPFPAIDVTISVNGLTCFDTVFHVVTSPVPPDQIHQYRLVSGSTFQRGCFNACDCPVGQVLPMIGTFALVPLAADPLRSEFAVANARWFVLGFATTAASVSGFPVRGDGVYLFGGDFALQQRMNLVMTVDKEDPAHFDSGLVIGGGTARIDVKVSVVGAVCADTILHIRAEPRIAAFPRPTLTDGEAP